MMDPNDRDPQDALDAPPAPPSTPTTYADGSRVLGMDGLPIGEVVASYRQHLIVERGYFFPTNYFIPYSAVAEASGGDIVLSLSRLDALRQGWERPPADPVAPVVAPLPAPPPDPTFPGRAAAESPSRPLPSSQTGTARPTSPPMPEEDPGSAARPVQEPAATPGPADVSSRPAPVADSGVDAAAATATASPPEQEEPAAPGAAPPGADAAGTARARGGDARAEPLQSPEAVVEPAATASSPAPGVAVQAEEAATDTTASTAAPATIGGEGAEPAPPATIPAPFVGIPGRRLTDAELWSLLDPKEQGAPDPSGGATAATDEADAGAGRAVPDADRDREP